MTNNFNTALTSWKAICCSWSISAKVSWDLAWKETAHPLIQKAILVPYSDLWPGVQKKGEEVKAEWLQKVILAKKSILWVKSGLYTLITGQTKILMKKTAQHQVYGSREQQADQKAWESLNRDLVTHHFQLHKSLQTEKAELVTEQEFLLMERGLCVITKRKAMETALPGCGEHSTFKNTSSRLHTPALPCKHTNQTLLWHEKPCTLSSKNPVLEVISAKHSSHLFQKPRG